MHRLQILLCLQSSEVDELVIDVDAAGRHRHHHHHHAAPPTTPTRTSRRLLSLSSPTAARDFSPPALASPKITFAVDDGRDKKKNQKKNKIDSESESDTDSDASDESFSDKPIWVQSLMPIKISAEALFTIDVTSPLGRRIKDKYVYRRPRAAASGGDPGDNAVDDDEEGVDGYEKYCHTPKRGATRFLERLRTREQESYPITFNRRRRIHDYQSHWIKFTWRERQEFLMVLKTGLTARARRLVRRVKPCSVRLKRITEADVRKWRRPPRPFQRHFPPNFSLSALYAMYPLANLPEPVPEHLRAAHHQQRHLLRQHLQQMQQRQVTTPVLTPEMLSGGSGDSLTKNMFAQSQLNGHIKPRGKGSENDMICISSDEEHDDSDTKVTSTTSDGAGSGTGSGRGGALSGVIRFKCHLCSTEIHGQLGSTDFIAEHFSLKHNVHNIRLHQGVDARGQTTVTIVQDIPRKSAPPPASSRTTPPPGAENTADSDVICIDD